MKNKKSIFWSTWFLLLALFIAIVDIYLFAIVPAKIIVAAVILNSILLIIDFATISYLGVCGIIVLPLIFYFCTSSNLSVSIFGILFCGYPIIRFNLIILNELLKSNIDHSKNSDIEAVNFLGAQEGFLFVRIDRKWMISNYDSMKSISNSKHIKIYWFQRNFELNGKQVKSLDLQMPSKNSLFTTINFDSHRIKLISLFDKLKNSSCSE